MLSPESIEAAGIFDPNAISMLVKKCQSAPIVGEVDSMALVGVLSTQLLYKQFIQERDANYSTPADFSVVQVNGDKELAYT
jgi:asparagine synthase (glutamine-hydrolysing)